MCDTKISQFAIDLKTNINLLVWSICAVAIEKNMAISITINRSMVSLAVEKWLDLETFRLLAKT